MDDSIADQLAKSERPSRRDVFWKTAIVLAVAVIVAAALRYGAHPFAFDAVRGARSPWTLVLAAGPSLAMLLYGLACLIHALRYRAVEPPSQADLPMLTVVVPAFNEGPMVRVSLLSALAADYPRDRLEIIAVDDGSTDDTWDHIAAVARLHPETVVAVRQPKNQGKREALRAGFLRARGEVVVTVDSDSRLDPGALRAAVAPIVADPEVAAVAGKVVVLNRYESLFTRLLAARFYLTFDLTRAAQSRFGAVLCCPGALTAYRRAAVMRVLDRWSSQTFLGSPCTIGEDRALTTWLLRDGSRSVYQSNAIVQTLVPTMLRGMVKMLIRWERGNIRETLVMIPLLFTSWRKRDRAWPTVEVIVDLLQFPLGALATIGIFATIEAPLATLLGAFASLGIVSMIQSLYCLRCERGTDFVYNVGYVFLVAVGLAWVFPYSCVTLRNGAWLTR